MGIVPVLISQGQGADVFDAVGGVPRAGDLLQVSKTGGFINPGRYVVSVVEWQDHQLPVVYLVPYTG